MRHALFTLMLLGIPLSNGLAVHADQSADAGSWQAGVSRVVITPPEFMWMSGYGGRSHAAEGKVHDLYARSTALRDSRGETVVFVATDLVGVPASMVAAVAAANSGGVVAPWGTICKSCNSTAEFVAAIASSGTVLSSATGSSLALSSSMATAVVDDVGIVKSAAATTSSLALSSTIAVIVAWAKPSSFV